MSIGFFLGGLACGLLIGAVLYVAYQDGYLKSHNEE